MRIDAEKLSFAKNLISDTFRWCTHSFAEDIGGEEVDPNSPNAVRWCAVGALAYAFGETVTRSTPESELLDDTAWLMGMAETPSLDGCAAIDINDKWGHASTMKMFDIAIRRARAMNGAETRKKRKQERQDV